MTKNSDKMCFSIARFFQDDDDDTDVQDNEHHDDVKGKPLPHLNQQLTLWKYFNKKT